MTERADPESRSPDPGVSPSTTESALEKGGDRDLESGSDRNLEVGVDWPATVGLYVATAAGGLVALIATVAGGADDAVIALVPTAFTGGLLCGAVLARIRPRIALRLGAWRWRTIVLWLPALTAAGGFGVLTATDVLPGTWQLGLVTASIVGIGGPAWLLERVARDAAVGTRIDREREAVATWTRYQSGTDASMIAYGVGFLLLAGAATVLASGGRAYRIPVQFVFLGVGCIAIGWAPTISLPRPGGEPIVLWSGSGVEYERGELRAYESGVVFEPKIIPTYRRFVPWERITDVRLTDDHLVLERRFRLDIRCDRSRITDPEGTLEALETVRRSGVTNHRLTSLERDRTS